MPQDIEQKLNRLLLADTYRTEVIDCLHTFLPQGYIAAGFIRNLVWDALHNKSSPTNLNDIDVIYFDTNEVEPQQQLYYQNKLKQHMPAVSWQVKNQAVMHIYNNEPAYKNLVDAMAHWPEKETAVAVRKNSQQQLEYLSAFGLEKLFNFTITHNPVRDAEIFKQRVNNKSWQSIWPQLKVLLDSNQHK